MSLSNTALLERAGNILNGMGVQKAAGDVHTSASMATGDFMDRKRVEALVDLTVGQSAWLSVTTVRLRDQRSGEIPRVNLTGVVTEGVPENGGQTVATHADTDNVPYNCGKYQATFFLTREAIREARASGEGNFEAKLRGAFGKAMGNDMALAAMLGNTSLTGTSRRNRLLNKRDGWMIKARAAANRNTTTRGSAWTQGVFHYMLDTMPEEYAEDANLRWFMPRKLDLSWDSHLTNLGTGDMGLRDRAKTERTRFAPLGIPQLVIPNMPSNQGFDTLSGSAVDADAVADDGDGTLTATVSALFGGYSSAHAGRKVKITLTSNGQTETLTVLDQGGANKIATAGSLGQSTISTTAGDYTLDVADVASQLLTNPANLFMVMCDKVRAYRKWQQEFERFRFDVFYEADFGIFNEDAVVLQDGIVPTTFAFGN